MDDFAKAEAVQSIGPDCEYWMSSPRNGSRCWNRRLRFTKNDPQIESFGATLSFITLNEYFVNTEGTVTRQGSTHYLMTLGASEQAPDGMRLDRSPQYASSRIEEMPTPEAFQSDAVKLVDQMKKLREAPVVEEDYRGPGPFFQ